MYYNILRNEVGELHADWNERGQAWIRDIKAHMERFRVKDGGGRRALIDTQIEHTKSMTQDEIAAWKRALTTPSARIKSAESDIKKHNAELNRKIEQALKLGLPEDGEVITRLRAALKGTV